MININQQSFPKSIELRQDFPGLESRVPLLGKVFADPTHLNQVFMNLCINARDAMPKGGILTVSAENFFVDDAFAQINLAPKVGNYWLVIIADTGTGIPPQVRDRMFDPFFTTKETGKGTGLGLSTALGIVKNNGGFLQISSEIGQGTQVKVYLPAIEGISTKTHQPEEPLNGHGELVMIVDDDVAAQRTTQALLESYHYQTILAHDRAEVIELYAQHQDDIRIVVLDVMMPNMNGIELIQKLKSMNPLIKIIAISGLPANRESVFATGANAFLAKPYPLEKLLSNISNLING